VCDGLVTVIPPLLVSVADGLVVTRASSDKTTGVDLNPQLLKKRPLCIASGVTFLLAPFLPRVVVCAPAEIPPGISVQSVGVIR